MRGKRARSDPTYELTTSSLQASLKPVQPRRIVDQHRAPRLLVREIPVEQADERVLLRAAAFLLAVGVRPVGAEDAAVGRGLVKLAAERHHVIPAGRLRRHAVAVAEQ